MSVFVEYYPLIYSGMSGQKAPSRLRSVAVHLYYGLGNLKNCGYLI